MKAVSAAVAVALAGAVAAQDWEGWSSTQEVDPVDPKTTTWSEWETSTKPVDPVDPSTTWSEWEATTTKKVDPVDPNTTWSDWEASTKKEYDPKKPKTTTWTEWETTTTTWEYDPNKPKTTTWSDWEATSTKEYDPKKPKSTTWADWDTTTKEVDPKKPKTTTWADWDTTTKEVDPTKPKTSTWSEWDDTTTTITATRTHTVTVTVQPAKTSAWSDWSATVTQTVSPAWSSDGWFGPTWTVDGQCSYNTITSYGEPAWQPTPASNWSDWATTTGKPVDPAKSTSWADWSATSSKPVDPVKSTTWADWSATSTKAADPAKSTGWESWSKSNTGISTNGNKWGMTYSPYDDNSGCKDKDTIYGDIAKIAEKGFTSVRVYGTQCKTLEYIGGACEEHGLKIILGVFIDTDGISGAQPQVDEICEWKKWEIVELIVVGNEAVFNNRCSAEDLAWFIKSSKDQFKQAGYGGLCTTTDELSVWQEHGEAWCDVVDVVAGNLYAFFNPETDAESAGDFIQSQIEVLSAICEGKETYVMESGWPSAGSCNGKACPSPENQEKAIKGIQGTSGAKVIFFSYEDENWKQPGQYGVEQHWGCGNVF